MYTDDAKLGSRACSKALPFMPQQHRIVFGWAERIPGTPRPFEYLDAQEQQSLGKKPFE